MIITQYCHHIIGYKHYTTTLCHYINTLAIMSGGTCTWSTSLLAPYFNGWNGIKGRCIARLDRHSMSTWWKATYFGDITWTCSFSIQNILPDNPPLHHMYFSPPHMLCYYTYYYLQEPKWTLALQPKNIENPTKYSILKLFLNHDIIKFNIKGKNWLKLNKISLMPDSALKGSSIFQCKNISCKTILKMPKLKLYV